MNPTVSQLNDQAWWSKVAPDRATHWCTDNDGYWYDKNSMRCLKIGGVAWAEPYRMPIPSSLWPRIDTEYQATDMIKRSKYHREIKHGVWIDVYDVIKAWAVDNPAQQHLIKKALQAGDRGHKSYDQDMEDIIASAARAKQLNAE